MRRVLIPLMFLSGCAIEPAEEFGELSDRVGAVEGALEGEGGSCECALSDTELADLKAEIKGELTSEILAALGVPAGATVPTTDDLSALDARVSVLEATADVGVDIRLAELERFSDPYLDGATTVAALVADVDGRLGVVESEYATIADIGFADGRLVSIEEFLVDHLGVGETLDEVTANDSDLQDFVDSATFSLALAEFADADAFAALEAQVLGDEIDLLVVEADVAALQTDVAGLGSLPADLAALDSRVVSIESDYLTAGELPGDVDLSNYVTNGDLAVSLGAYATVSDLASFVKVIDLPLFLAPYTLASDFAVVQGDYVTSAELNGAVAPLASDLAVDSLNASLLVLDGRLSSVEATYVSDADLSGAIAPLASDLELASLDSRVSDIEFDYVLGAELGPLATDVALAATNALVVGLDSRVDSIESDYTNTLELNAALVPFVTDLEFSSMDLRVDTIEAEYLVVADLAGLAGDAELAAVQAVTSNLDARVDLIELDYTTGAELSTALVPFATDLDVGGLDLRLDSIESDFITSFELVPFATDIDVGILQGVVTSLDTRVDNIEADFTTTPELAAALLPFATDLELSGIDGRIDTIEADYLTSSDLGSYYSSAEGAALEDRVEAIELGGGGGGDVSGFVTEDELAVTLLDYSLEADMVTLDGRVSEIEADYVIGADLTGYALLTDLGDLLDFADYLIVAPASNKITLSGANVFIDNGSSSTASTNTFGNLILGFNEGGGMNGSHSLILGQNHDFNSYGVILSGNSNVSTAPYASVIGATARTNNLTNTTVATITP